MLLLYTHIVNVYCTPNEFIYKKWAFCLLANAVLLLYDKETKTIIYWMRIADVYKMARLLHLKRNKRSFNPYQLENYSLLFYYYFYTQKNVYSAS